MGFLILMPRMAADVRSIMLRRRGMAGNQGLGGSRSLGRTGDR